MCLSTQSRLQISMCLSARSGLHKRPRADERLGGERCPQSITSHGIVQAAGDRGVAGSARLNFLHPNPITTTGWHRHRVMMMGAI
jgi:hypothetical protein